MPLICAERARLLERYQGAIRQYIEAVNSFVRLSGDNQKCEDARATIYDVRDQLLQHCRDCGCDPDLALIDKNL